MLQMRTYCGNEFHNFGAGTLNSLSFLSYLSWARQVLSHPVILIHNGWFYKSAFPIPILVHDRVRN